MSRRTADASKAIRLAWDQEQQRVLNGEGTRDWTKQQQQDIIDKGKAYDDDGKAFEGQHMKSAAEYPEYQGDPNNIQFLTHQEHFDAHKGNWKNPTNWYYDPFTKAFTDFGDGDFISCKVIKLSDPVYPSESIMLETEKGGVVETSNDEIVKGKSVVAEYADSFSDAPIAPQTPPSVTNAKHKSFFGKVGQFFADRPVLTKGLKIIGAFAGGYIAGKVASGSSSGPSNSSDSGNAYSPSDPYDDHGDSTCDDSSKSADERLSPEEHTVPAHGQHYHTKEGKVWKEKKPYKRGGKHEDD